MNSVLPAAVNILALLLNATPMALAASTERVVESGKGWKWGDDVFNIRDTDIIGYYRSIRSMIFEIDISFRFGEFLCRSMYL